MNVLRVIPSMDPSSGGPCQGIRNTIPELNKIGIHNEVVCLDDPNSEFLRQDIYPIYALGKGKGPWKYNKNLFSWLMENLERFDILIVHGLWLYHSYAVRTAIISFRKYQNQNNPQIPKLYVMPHGMLDPYFQQASGRKLKALRNWLYWKLIESRIVNEADGLLFTCESELQLARKPFRPYHPKNEINVGYGITEPPEFTQKIFDRFQEICPEVKNRRYILFLSRIHEKKGVSLLIKAYLEFTRKIEESNANFRSPNNSILKNEQIETKRLEWPILVVAGPGMDTSYGEYLKKLAKGANRTDPLIIFPGMLSGANKWGAFFGCEAFILPSHQENFGIAVVEALACGKPVLISNQVNIYKEIENEGGGLINKDNLEGIIALLKNWFELSGTQKIEMGIKARSTYEKFFSLKPHVIRLKKTFS